MKLIVPDKIMPSVGEKVLRQYSCAKLSSSLSTFKANATVAITNRRIILYADSNKKTEVLQNEIFVDNVSGVSFFKGRPLKRKGTTGKFLFLFAFFAIISALIFWQNAFVFSFVSTLIPSATNDLAFKLLSSLTPVVLFLLIYMLIFACTRKYTINIIVHSKNFYKSNINIQSVDADLITSSFYIEPNPKEAQRMISELSSIILDIQKYGPDEVLKHIESEDSVLDSKAKEV